MSLRGLYKRTERLHQKLEQFAKAHSIPSKDCICFQGNEQPIFSNALQLEIASAVKCPLHGDRFFRRSLRYMAIWLIPTLPRFRQRKSPQHRKAWAASFSFDFWPAQEEQIGEETYLRLKDGTLAPASESLLRWARLKPSATTVPGARLPIIGDESCLPIEEELAYLAGLSRLASSDRGRGQRK